MNTVSTENDVVLNDIYALKCSETQLMETQYRSQHQFNKTGDVDFVEEGLSDFVKTIKIASTNSMGRIKQFGDSIVKGIHLYCTDFGKFVNKNKKFFEDLPEKSIDFTIEGFNYSATSSPRINLSELDNVIAGYNQFITGLSRQLQGINSDDLDEYFDRYLDDANMAKICKHMMSYNHDIMETDFLTTVKKSYRSGEVTPISVRVHKGMVMSIIKHYSDVEKDAELTARELDALGVKCRTVTQFLQSTIESLNDSKTKSVPLGTISITKDGKFSVRNILEVGGDNVDVVPACISFIRRKYAQIVKLQEMAQVILSERLKALQDEIRQNSDILKLCMVEVPKKMLVDLTGSSTKTPVLQKHLPNVPSETSVMLEAINYTELALENLICMESEYCSVFEQRYREEIRFFMTCMESGVITSAVLEASSTKEKFEKIKAAMIEFLDKLIALFRKKVVDYSKRYKKWINDIGVDTLKEKAAEKTDGVSAAPYWEAQDVSKDIKSIASAMNSAVSNNDSSKLSFTSQFVNGIDDTGKFAENRGDLAGYLKNYFRFHKKNQKEVKKEQISGNDLVNKVAGMVEYINNYDSFVTLIENSIGKAIENNVNTLSRRETMESFAYMQLENAPASTTELGLMEGFELLLEAEEKAGVVTNDKGEAESATSINTPEKDGSDSNNTSDKASNSAEYARIFQSFFQLAISSLMTAMEERYITYINILSYIAGERPKVDKDGNYVPKEDTKDNTKVESTGESALPTSLYTKPATMKGTSLYI